LTVILNLFQDPCPWQNGETELSKPKPQRTINITSNGQSASVRVAKRLSAKFSDAGFIISESFSKKAELTVCVGGDGALLNMLADNGFPSIPIAGINTGHLGFFQDINSRNLDDFIAKYKSGDYTKQKLKTVYADVVIGDTPQGRRNVPERATETVESGDIPQRGVSPSKRLFGLNDIVIKGGSSHLTHLNISIGDTFVETFRGDGVVVSTPAGSTAYNYSLGGSIVDPGLDLLQVTPIAPVNSTAYRSFTSSVLVPPDQVIVLRPEYPKSDELLLTSDGIESVFNGISEIRCGFTGKQITLLRFSNFDFWNTVKEKLL
jgi:NAD+ kinase